MRGRSSQMEWNSQAYYKLALELAPSESTLLKPEMPRQSLFRRAQHPRAPFTTYTREPAPARPDCRPNIFLRRPETFSCAGMERDAHYFLIKFAHDLKRGFPLTAPLIPRILTW